MAHYQITLDSEIVQGIFQKDGGLSKLVEQVLNQVLEAQVGEQLQAAPYERTEERQGYRKRRCRTGKGSSWARRSNCGAGATVLVRWFSVGAFCDDRKDALRGQQV